MFEKIINFVKGLFIKEDGGVNWRTLLMAGAGAAAGGFGLVGEGGLISGLIGAVLGVGASAAVGAVLPSSGAPAAEGPEAGGEEASAGRGRAPAYEPPVPSTPMRATNTRER